MVQIVALFNVHETIYLPYFTAKISNANFRYCNNTEVDEAGRYKNANTPNFITGKFSTLLWFLFAVKTIFLLLNCLFNVNPHITRVTRQVYNLLQDLWNGFII